MYRFVLFLILILLFSCSERREKKYYNYYWAGEIRSRKDTFFFHQKITERNDSVILENEGKYGQDDKKTFVHLFIFNSKDKTKAFYNQASGTGAIFEYLNDTIVRAGERNYRVFEYLVDEVDSYDAAGNFFWCPDIGVVYIRTVQAHFRLYTNNRELDSTIGNVINSIREF